MSKIIAHQTQSVRGASARGGKKRPNLQITWLMTAQVQKHREIGCEVRKKGPSQTTPRHSLNLCNGYAAGDEANLPCKESPFCTQPLQRERNWVSGSQWAQGKGGRSSATHIRLPEWQKLVGGVRNERFSWSRAETFSSQHCGASSIFRKKRREKYREKS